MEASELVASTEAHALHFMTAGTHVRMRQKATLALRAILPILQNQLEQR